MVLTIRLKGDCEDGTLKVTEKTGNTWKDMNSNNIPPLNCGSEDTFLIHVNGKKFVSVILTTRSKRIHPVFSYHLFLGSGWSSGKHP